MPDDPFEFTFESLAAFLFCLARVLHGTDLATRKSGQMSGLLRDGLDYTIGQAVSGQTLPDLSPKDRESLRRLKVDLDNLLDDLSLGPPQ